MKMLERGVEKRKADDFYDILIRFDLDKVTSQHIPFFRVYSSASGG